MKTGGVGSRKAGAVSTPKARIWKGLKPLFQDLEHRKGAIGAVGGIYSGRKFHTGTTGIRLQGQDKFLQDRASQVVMKAFDLLGALLQTVQNSGPDPNYPRPVCGGPDR